MEIVYFHDSFHLCAEKSRKSMPLHHIFLPKNAKAHECMVFSRQS